jgi:hypothetical protein
MGEYSKGLIEFSKAQRNATSHRTSGRDRRLRDWQAQSRPKANINPEIAPLAASR